jgi:uncharacterized protein (DUF1778 family)
MMMAVALSNLRAKAANTKKASAKRRSDVREPLNMRIRPEMRQLIDRAAKMAGKNRTDFVLDAARQAAQDALLDQTNIVLDPKSYAAFVRLLDTAPKPTQRLRKVLATPAIWD